MSNSKGLPPFYEPRKTVSLSSEGSQGETLGDVFSFKRLKPCFIKPSDKATPITYIDQLHEAIKPGRVAIFSPNYYVHCGRYQHSFDILPSESKEALANMRAVCKERSRPCKQTTWLKQQ
jgi:hypothetical protein